MLAKKSRSHRTVEWIRRHVPFGDTWPALKTTLRVLEKNADAFPPLKSAIGGFIACLDIVEAAAGNREDYNELLADFIQNGETLEPYMSKFSSQGPNIDVNDLATCIKEQTKYIEKKRSRGKLAQLLTATEDQEDVLRCCRKEVLTSDSEKFALDLQVWENVDKLRMDSQLRALSPAYDACYDSQHATTIMRRGCTAQTREQVQADLKQWIHDPDAPKMRWMNGMAGTGKTTIAYSLCEWLEANNQLGASFFCTRTLESCLNINNIVPTVAYQLARYSPAYRFSLRDTLDRDSDAGRKSIKKQFQKLIWETVKNVNDVDSMLGGFVVVIDALDECENKQGIQVFLGELLQFAKDFPLKFFLTSRPEYIITREMRNLPTVVYLHDIEESIVEEDIKKYLAEAFSRMAEPPSANEIARLAKHAGKLFIYAATAVRYIFPENKPVDSKARLQAMLEIDSKLPDEIRSDKKYQDLDRLYATILDEAFEGLEPGEITNMQRVLGTIICLKGPLTFAAIAVLLDLADGQILVVLHSLQSVLHLSEKAKLVSILHASFPDYMLTQHRCGRFYCNESGHNHLLTSRCFKVMEQQLRFNICRLESSSVFDNDIQDLEKSITQFISPELFYACRYWSEHLRLSSPAEDLRAWLIDFISHRLLFWMEVMNLQGCRGAGIAALEQAQEWLASTTGMADIGQQVIEAQDFAARFFSNACSQSTPHIYISALPSFGKSNNTSESYRKRTRRLIDMKGTMVDERGRGSMSTWVVGSPILALAVSPDGKHIVSGSTEHTIRVWDAHTGKHVIGLFKGHIGSMCSVAYSPDGTRIISGSWDKTIRVWDAHTGGLVAGPLVGHTDWVRSVTYSPDGTRIASGSDDMTIRVWNAHTGRPVANLFEGHINSVSSVVYSSDGTRIVSGSWDKTIRVWNARTGKPVAGPFEGHTGYVLSVACSPDGTRIASSSSDMTIRVWDAHTGKPAANTLTGHLNSVNSVVYSSDGTRIASGSQDKTIRVWDAHTGILVAGPFTGHTDDVNSVTYSPNGMRIISGSDDGTIRVWDKRLSNVVAGHSEAHTKCVMSVAVSPDGTRIVSGSYDATIRIWDAATGRAAADPFVGHADWVNSVTYSPNGIHIASGSADRTIRVWDAHTGQPLADPFKGHTAPVRSVAYSPNCTRIVSGSDDKSIRVWDAHTGSLVAGPFLGHTGPVNSVAYSPDHIHIVSGSKDKTIRVWDAHTGQLVADPFVRHTDWVNSVTYSPDGTHIISGSNARTIRIWNAHTGRLIIDPFQGHAGGINSVAYSPDGSHIVSGSWDSTVIVWNAHTGVVVAGPFEGGTSGVNSVVFTPSGTHIVAGFGSTQLLGGSCGIRVLHVAPQTKPPTNLLGPWSFHPDGWVTAEDVPLFWCPPDLHDHLPHPWESLVIGPRGSIQIDYSDVALGDNWADCYVAG